MQSQHEILLDNLLTLLFKLKVKNTVRYQLTVPYYLHLDKLRAIRAKYKSYI